MKLIGFVVHESFLGWLFQRLVERSCYFTVEPWPEDQWRIEVKPENEAWLRQLVDETT
jgi:hypothetical protein